MTSGRFRNVLTAGLLASAAWSASSCSGAKNTELIVAIQTDLRVPKDLNAITVEVFAGGQRIAGDTYVVGPTGLHLPATIGIVPNDPSKLNPVDVVITGRFSDNVDETLRTPRVIRKARLTFARDRVALVRMPLKFACYDAASCPDGKTCVAGACEPIPQIEGAAMPAYSNELVFGAGGNSDQVGECWNAEQCLAATTTLAPAGECVWSLTGGGAAVDAGAPVPDGGADMSDGGVPFKSLDLSKSISIALAKAGGKLGFCSGETCRVPLDQDANEGWDWADEAHTSIRLAPGLCDKVRKESLAVEGTDACKTKVAELPFCDEGSGGSTGGGSDAGTSPCATGRTACGGACVDLKSDPNNCGACGVACSATETCTTDTGGVTSCTPRASTDAGSGGGGPDASSFDSGASSDASIPPG